jgi:hypothetical protein
MSTLSTFFKGSETHLGVFYPRDYLIAAFPDLQAARDAEKRLLGAGFAADEVTAVAGDELRSEHAKHHSFFELFMQSLSRFFQTEEAYADRDVELAARGAGFLLVYCPSEDLKHRAWRLVEAGHPLVARHYALTGIEHLAGES